MGGWGRDRDDVIVVGLDLCVPPQRQVLSLDIDVVHSGPAFHGQGKMGLLNRANHKIPCSFSLVRN